MTYSENHQRYIDSVGGEAHQSAIEIIAELEKRGWQTIDTAPKDGTEILVWNQKYDFAPIVSWHGENLLWNCRGAAPSGCAHYETIGWQDDEDNGLLPTHWMPILIK